MKISRKRVIAIISILCVIVVGFLFLKYRAPIKARYDQDTQEMIISPGFFYTLEGYDTWAWDFDNVPIQSGEALAPLSDPADREYRFRPVYGESEIQMLVIFYRDGLTGERADARLRVARARMDGPWYHFGVIGENNPIRLSFIGLT